MKIFNALFYAKINAFILPASSGFFSCILTKKKKKRKPPRSNYALAVLLALWLAFKKGLKP
ncbi:hypothetical protein BB450_05300 [Helicobacter pylori]|nr:hypothetical protein BB450_05300 [Helicobacter pylori]PDX04191.1 hypothetical protein BB402_02890 [Helicobacter pylori]